MPLNLLSVPVGGIEPTIGETALYALIGFLIVFVGIAFLVFIVWLVGAIISRFTTKKQPPKKETIAEDIPVSSVDEEEISEETVAVIMAALTAYYQTNQPKCEFTVKRIKRI